MQNTPAGAILRPMLPLAEQRKLDLETIAALEAEIAAEREEYTRKLHIESERTPSEGAPRPAPKPKTKSADCEPENTPAGAILGPMLRKR